MKNKVTLGITGSIAAYKIPALLRELVKKNLEVKAILTKNAANFVTPLTLSTISKNVVHTNMFSVEKSMEMEHITLADWADAVLVAPATANIIGKFASGIADDLLSTLLLSADCPIIIAPAMNTKMYHNPVVQRNIKILQENGIIFCEPDIGELACGVEGEGRLTSFDKIIDSLTQVLNSENKLSKKKVLITAGGTREKIDPVRFISNRSSGKMGYALAEAFAKFGADVTLISAPTPLIPPSDVKIIYVETAAEMFEAVKKEFLHNDIIIKAAAVADYTPIKSNKLKIKKHQENFTLQLKPTHDILSFIGKNKTNKHILIGFAAETDNHIQNALSKLKSKNLDMIILNDVLSYNSGFESDYNKVVLISKKSKQLIELPLLTKKQVAHRIVQEVIKIVHSA